MSDALLDYSSWSFQLIIVLAVLYLVIGLLQPSWVMARKRSTIVIVSVLVLLLASTAFYVAVQPLQQTGGTNTLSMQDMAPPDQASPPQ
jgi:cytochrome c oxidase assembly factor CtaG